MSDPIEVPRDGRPLYVLHLRVRQYETDALGHVNNAVYLNYPEAEGGRRMTEDGRRKAEDG